MTLLGQFSLWVALLLGVWAVAIAFSGRWQDRPDLAASVTGAVYGMFGALAVASVALWKGLVAHDWDGPRHTYRPTADPAQVQKSAARHLLQTFFNNSMESAVAAMLGAADRSLTPDELDRLSQLIEQARRRKTGGARK